MKNVFLALVLGVAVTGSAAEGFRTDINPALLYHQAFLLTPELSAEDRKYLFESEWRNKTPDTRYAELVKRYDNTFKLIRRAAHAGVSCDWGLDMTDGPDALLPGLARAKSATQVACMRARQHLIDGDQDLARDELLATIVMARNISSDGVLISALVQIAIENIVTSFVAENFYRFDPDALQEIANGLNSGPARGQVGQCMAVEKYSFCDWLVRKIQELDAISGGNQQRLHAQLREMWSKSLFSPDDNGRDFLDRFLGATDGSAAGLVSYVKQLEPLYAEATQILSLPWSQYEGRNAEFERKLGSHTNVLAQKFFPALGNSRKREFAIQAKLAMLHAAISYKLHGDAAFNSIADPFGDGPFTFRRFILDGVDRGFELESKLNCRGHVEKLILIEKPGPAVRVDSKYVGQKIP